MKTGKSRLFVLTFMALSFSFLSGHAQTDTAHRKFTVVLDAGHGGKDPGYVVHKYGYEEKNIALPVILDVGKILEKRKDMKVIYTRKTDVFVTLMGRAQVANRNHADLFVSVHCNGFKSSSPHGTETFVLGTYRNKDNLEIAMKENSVIYLEDNYKVTYNGFDPKSYASYISMTMMQEEYHDQSILLADMIQNQFTNSLHRFDRGVKQAGFLVLRETFMPGVLIEIGFLTNRNEGRYLSSRHGQKEIAASIAAGIVKYKESLNLHARQVIEEHGDTVHQPKEQTAPVNNHIVFRIQLVAGSTPLETAPYNFNGLKGVQRKKEGSLYKYYYGKSSDYVTIQDMQRTAIDKGYIHSYIVAFKDGRKMTVSQALKTKANNDQ